MPWKTEIDRLVHNLVLDAGPGGAADVRRAARAIADLSALAPERKATQFHVGALEEILGGLSVAAFPVVVVSSVVAAVVSRAVFGNHPAFPIPEEYGYQHLSEVSIAYPLLGVIIGVVAAVFIRVFFRAASVEVTGGRGGWYLLTYGPVPGDRDSQFFDAQGMALVGSRIAMVSMVAAGQDYDYDAGSEPMVTAVQRAAQKLS